MSLVIMTEDSIICARDKMGRLPILIGKQNPSDDAVALNCIKAEALALRGLALFDLTRLFAMPYTLNNGTSLGVPIEIKTTLPTHQPARNTVAECYQQVIDDMTGALKLSALSADKKNGYLNVWSVKALLSRVYLYMNDSEKALALAKEVMNNGGLYQLFTHDEYPTVWGKDFSSESLFEFYYTLSEPMQEPFHYHSYKDIPVKVML